MSVVRRGETSLQIVRLLQRAKPEEIANKLVLATEACPDRPRWVKFWAALVEK